MSYFRKGMGATETVNLSWPGSSPTIEMGEDFVGNVNALPICPKTDQNGWCRKYVGGPAVKSAINYTPPTQQAASATAAVANAVTSAVTGLLSSLTAPAKLPGVTAPAPAAARPAGMSTTTKVALAGGAVLLVALLARR